MILSKKRITKALIRLHGCAGWSATVLFTTPHRQVFLRQCPFMFFNVNIVGICTILYKALVPILVGLLWMEMGTKC